MSRRALQHIARIQTALKADGDDYRVYAWEVRDALSGWENEIRLEQWERKMADYLRRAA